MGRAMGRKVTAKGTASRGTGRRPGRRCENASGPAARRCLGWTCCGRALTAANQICAGEGRRAVMPKTPPKNVRDGYLAPAVLFSAAWEYLPHGPQFAGREISTGPPKRISKPVPVSRVQIQKGCRSPEPSIPSSTTKLSSQTSRIPVVHRRSPSGLSLRFHPYNLKRQFPPKCPPRPLTRSPPPRPPRPRPPPRRRTLARRRPRLATRRSGLRPGRRRTRPTSTKVGLLHPHASRVRATICHNGAANLGPPVLKQVHPDTGISNRAMSILNSFVNGRHHERWLSRRHGAMADARSRHFRARRH